MIIQNDSDDRYVNIDLSGKSIFVKIVATIVLILIANFLKYLLHDYIGEGTPFLIYFAFIMLCGRFIGFWPAITCMITCGIIAVNFFIFPYEYFSTSAVIKVLIYLIEGVFIASLSNGFRKNLNQLGLNNRNFKILVSKSQDGLAKISKDGKILYISPSMEIITGYNQTDLENGGFDIFPEETDKALVVKNFLSILNKDGENITFIHRYTNKQKEIRWMETIFTNHLEIKGIDAIVANFRDVSERVEAAIKKNDFIGVVAHEIKNPLAVVKLNADLLQQSLANNDLAQIQSYNNSVRSHAKRIIDLLNDLMNFSSFESALRHLNFTAFNLHTAVENAILVFNSTYTNEVKIFGEASIIVFADRARIEQVLVNLLSNASKYSNKNDHIVVDCKIMSESVIIRIIDNGIGIAEHEINYLFNKFYRVNTIKNHAQGYGLGLYICAEIIKAHNGKIGVESSEGKGSVFWFSLPR